MTSGTDRAAVASEPGLDERLLGDVSAAIDQALASVEGLRRTALSLVEEVGRSDRALRRGDLQRLRPEVADLLRRHEGFMAGAGVVMARGVLQDAQLWIEWSWLTDSAEIEQLEVDLDPDSPEFYDYTTTEWYREPERTREHHLAGPYVDYICTHEYTFTLSTPLVANGHFIGVAGADILASQVERLVLPRLAELRYPTALVSGNGRVISSNTTAIMPGMTISRPGRGDAFRPVAGTGGGLPASKLRWKLVQGEVRSAASPGSG